MITKERICKNRDTEKRHNQNFNGLNRFISVFTKLRERCYVTLFQKLTFLYLIQISSDNKKLNYKGRKNVRRPFSFKASWKKGWPANSGIWAFDSIIVFCLD